MSRFVNPQPRYVDSNGKALTAGKLFFYSAGTVTPRDTFSDASFTIANTNPIILDANGRPETDIFLNGVYKVVLKDALDNTVWEKDPVGGAIGVAAFDDWIVDATYDVGNVVTASDGNYYVSLSNGNIGLDPTIESGDWERVQFLQEWRSDVTYAANDFVIGSDSTLYKSSAGSNLNNDPVTDSVNWSSVRDYAGVPNGFATLDGDGLVPSSQIPPIAITDVYVVANQAARLALDAQVGDIAVQQDVNIAYILQSLPASTNANWIQLGAQGFGTAAFRNIGTGATNVPDNTQLNTRLGTSGNLGTAATRNVGRSNTNVPQYVDAAGISGTGWDGYAPVVASETQEAGLNVCQLYRAASASTTVFAQAGVGLNLPYDANNDLCAQVWYNLGTQPMQWRQKINSTTWGPVRSVWDDANLSPVTTNTTQTITGVKTFSTSPEILSADFTPYRVTRAGFTGEFGVSTSGGLNQVIVRLMEGTTERCRLNLLESGIAQLTGSVDIGGAVITNGETITLGAVGNTSYKQFEINRNGIVTRMRAGTGDSRFGYFNGTTINEVVFDSTTATFSNIITAPSVIATTTLRSDPALKTERKAADITREQLDSISLEYFKWREDMKAVPDYLKGKQDIGVMADAVEAVFPECIVMHEGYRTVDYAKLGVCLTLADMKLRREGK